MQKSCSQCGSPDVVEAGTFTECLECGDFAGKIANREAANNILIKTALHLMTPEQVSQWKGVKHWLERHE